MPAVKHVHKYKFVPIGKSNENRMYRCGDPRCSHYMPNYMLINPLRSVCWECGDEFNIDTSTNNKVHPLCSDCTREIEEGIEGYKKGEKRDIHDDAKEEVSPKLEAFIKQIYGKE